MRKTDTSKAHYVGLEQRIAPRSDVYYRLPMAFPDGRVDICTCINISADGMLMRYDQELEIGDALNFDIPVVGRIDASVIWSLSGKTGVQFDKSIAVEDYLPLVRAMGSRED